MHRPRLAVFGHDTGSKLLPCTCQVGVHLRKWSVAFAILSREVPARSICLVVASHGVGDHGSNEIISPSFLFQSSNSFFFCLLLCSMHAWRKRRVSVAVGRRSEILLMFTSISFCLAFLGQDNLHCEVLLPSLRTDIM